MTIQTQARNATLEDLVPMLMRQQSLKHDAIVPATAITSVGGLLHVQGMSVTEPALVLRPTAIMDGQIAEKLGIPVRYLRALRETRPDLYDANVNGWLHGFIPEPVADAPLGIERLAATVDGVVAPDKRRFLVRTFTEAGEVEGIGRALLGDKFKVIDNLDVLMAALEGIRESGVEATVTTANVTETRMQVRFSAPGIAVNAPELMRNYNPQVPGWGDMERLRRVAESEGLKYEPGREPVIFAGFDVTNGETGGTAFNLTPVLDMEVCGNKLRLNVLAQRQVHLGARQAEGVIDWSATTREAELTLIKSQTVDAVRAFLNIEFLAGEVAKLEAKAGKPIEGAVTEAVEFVSNKLKWTEEQQAGILDHFIKGGQFTAGGILNAVTSYAQTVESADEAFDLENSAIEALEVAYAAA